MTLSLDTAMSLTFTLASSRVTLFRSFFSIRRDGGSVRKREGRKERRKERQKDMAFINRSVKNKQIT